MEQLRGKTAVVTGAAGGIAVWLRLKPREPARSDEGRLSGRDPTDPLRVGRLRDPPSVEIPPLRLAAGGRAKRLPRRAVAAFATRGLTGWSARGGMGRCSAMGWSAARGKSWTSTPSSARSRRTVSASARSGRAPRNSVPRGVDPAGIRPVRKDAACARSRIWIFAGHALDLVAHCQTSVRSNFEPQLGHRRVLDGLSLCGILESDRRCWRRENR